MSFYQRLAYYLVGVLIGGIAVFFILGKKKSQCSYMPNARILKNISTKPLQYDLEASRKLAEDWVDTVDIKNTLKYGDVDFDKSNTPYKKGKLYVIQGITTKKDTIYLRFINYPTKAVLEDILRKPKK